MDKQAIEPNGNAMSPRVKIPYEGDTVDAEELDFKVLSSTPIVINIGDGSKIEMEHTVARIYRLCDKKKEDGSPIYVMVGATKLTTTTPQREDQL